MVIKDFRIPVGNMGESLHVHTRHSNKQQPHSVVVLSHGFTGSGFGSHRIFMQLADALAEAGHLALAFDYRGSGFSSGAFEDLTITREIEDLRTVLAYIRGQYGNGIKIGILGHSLGGSISAYVCAKDAGIAAQVLWGGLFNTVEKFSARTANEEGWVYYGDRVCHSDKGYFLKTDFLEDVLRYDIYEEIQGCAVSTLFVHGTADRSVPIAQAARAFDVYAGEKKFVRQEGGTHLLHCQEALEKDLFAEVVGWMKKYL